MSTAERRAAKEAATQRDKAHDLLVAVLAKEGGVIRVPRKVIESAMRSSVSTVWEGDMLVIWLGEVEHRPEPEPVPSGLLGRLRGRA